MDRKVLTIALTVTLSALVSTSVAWANVPNPEERDQAARSGDSGAVILYALPSPNEVRVTALRPVQIPGRVLQPGEYSLRLSGSGSVVTVSNLDGSEFYGNYLVVPAYRSHRSDIVAYTTETRGGPERITSWFVPGSLRGHAFLYPKGKHGNVQIAAK